MLEAAQLAAQAQGLLPGQQLPSLQGAPKGPGALASASSRTLHKPARAPLRSVPLAPLRTRGGGDGPRPSPMLVAVTDSGTHTPFSSRSVAGLARPA